MVEDVVEENKKLLEENATDDESSGGDVLQQENATTTLTNVAAAAGPPPNKKSKKNTGGNKKNVVKQRTNNQDNAAEAATADGPSETTLGKVPPRLCFLLLILFDLVLLFHLMDDGGIDSLVSLTSFGKQHQEACSSFFSFATRSTHEGN